MEYTIAPGVTTHHRKVLTYARQQLEADRHKQKWERSEALAKSLKGSLTGGELVEANKVLEILKAQS